MSESDKNIFDPKTIFDTWMRSMSDMSSDMGQSQFDPAKIQDSQKKAGDQVPWFDKQFKSSLNAWQSFTSALTQMETLVSVYKGMGSFPEFFLKMIQPAFEGVSAMYQQWLAQFEKTGKISGEFRFDQMDKESLNVFTRLYDGEFRKFLNMPQLGIAREYQEKINRFFDRFNLFQTAMAEFLGIVFQPFEKTHSAFQEKLSELIKTNLMPEDPKSYYQAWLKILEKEYMLLFKTPEYLSSLTKTINAAADYKTARRDLGNDLLHEFSIPSSTDVEAVYKDLHDLKRRLKKIEKAMAKK